MNNWLRNGKSVNAKLEKKNKMRLIECLIGTAKENDSY